MGINYLDVRLKAGERWVYQPPKNHDVAWISYQGAVLTPNEINAGEAVIFEQGNKPIEFKAVTDTGVILGSAVKHPHQLVMGCYSVHTTLEALRQGESNIKTIGHDLHQEGILGSNGRR